MSIVSWSEETDVDLANDGGQKFTAVTRLGSVGTVLNNSGGFAVAWGELTEAGWSVKGQIYAPDAQPLGNEFTIATGIVDLISIDARQVEGNGDQFVVGWRDGDTSSGRTFDTYGTPVGGVSGPHPATVDGEHWVHLGGSLNFRRTVVLEQNGDDLFVKYGTMDGTVTFAINTTPLAGETAMSVARVGGDLRFTAVWSTLNGEGEYEVRARSYFVGEPPAPLHYEILVATDLGAAPVKLEVIGTNSGGFMAVWLDADAGQILAQEYTLAGERLGEVFVVNDLPLGEISDLEISAAAVVDGRVAITWESSGDVHWKLVDPRPVVGSPGDDEIVGTSGRDVLYGAGGDDHLSGLAGNDDLSGGAGNDLLEGGSGDDIYYVEDALDQITELAGEGFDRVRASADFTLNDGAYVEVIETQDAAGTDPIDLAGNNLTNYVTGNAGANVLSGGSGGTDALEGLGGDDTYLVKPGDVIVEQSDGGFDTAIAQQDYQLNEGAYIEVVRTDDDSGTVAINLSGNSFANTLVGNSGANLLDGKAGADQMVGNGGDDTYVVDDAGDQVVEHDAGDGLDRVNSSVDYRLGSNVEVLVLLGSADIDATGHNLANTLVGNSGANVLNGKGGADYMAGQGGDDTFVVDDAGDEVVELGGEGFDQVNSFIDFRLGPNLEQLHLLGTADVDGTGNEVGNTLVGNSGSNVLNGKAGADYMAGNGGDDTYVVDDAGDFVFERDAGDGYDRVNSYIDYRLGSNVEALELLGSANISATGHNLANTLIGNAGNNLLNGKGGADYMAGNGGDDTYVVDDAGDLVFERDATEGNDRVDSYIDYRLGSNVELLVLLGSADIDGTGHNLANTLVGNSGANVLNGKGGADYMAGHGGDDTFVVDDAGDEVVELGGEGFDQVNSYIDFRLGPNLEQLNLLGTADVDGTGNELANTLVGNSGANLLNGRDGADDLSGGAGDDRLFGGSGDDILRGGAGSDGFYFTSPLDWFENVDTMVDFFAADDSIFLDRTVFGGFEQSGALSEDAFVMGSAAQDAADRVIYNQSNGYIFYDSDGTGSGDAVLFAQIAPASTLSHEDFFIV